MKNAKLSVFFMFIVLTFALLPGCKEPENYDFLPFEEDVTFETSRAVKKVEINDKLTIPIQPNSEIKWTSTRQAPRAEMDPKLNGFIKENIFWAGKTSVLMLDRQGKNLRYIWIDPVGIKSELRYGADVICVSNTHSKYFSPKDIEKIDDGYTTLISPELKDYQYSLTDNELFVKPFAHFNVKGTKIATTPAAVKGMTGQNIWDNNVGYIFWIGGYSIWYTGALSADMIGSDYKLLTQDNNKELTEEEVGHLIPGKNRDDLYRIHDVDIMIVPISSPAKITAEFIIELSKHVNAKAIYIVGYDSIKTEKLNTFRKTIYKDSPVPFWYPVKFKATKDTPKPVAPKPADTTAPKPKPADTTPSK